MPPPTTGQASFEINDLEWKTGQIGVVSIGVMTVSLVVLSTCLIGTHLLVIKLRPVAQRLRRGLLQRRMVLRPLRSVGSRAAQEAVSARHVEAGRSVLTRA